MGIKKCFSQKIFKKIFNSSLTIKISERLLKQAQEKYNRYKRDNELEDKKLILDNNKKSKH